MIQVGLQDSNTYWCSTDDTFAIQCAVSYELDHSVEIFTAQLVKVPIQIRAISAAGEDHDPPSRKRREVVPPLRAVGSEHRSVRFLLAVAPQNRLVHWRQAAELQIK